MFGPDDSGILDDVSLSDIFGKEVLDDNDLNYLENDRYNDVDVDIDVEEIVNVSDVDNYTEDDDEEDDDDNIFENEIGSNCIENVSLSDIYDVNDMIVNSDSIINSEVIESKNFLTLCIGLVIRR